MSNISKLVDDRVEWIKKERAVLDDLKKELDKREADISDREESLDGGLVSMLEERKTLLKTEVEAVTNELNMLRNEKSMTLKEFGIDIENIHAQVVSEKEKEAEDLQDLIEALVKEKTKTERDVDQLKKELDDLKKQKEADANRYEAEKVSYVARIKAEKEAELQEISMLNTKERAALEQKKNELSSDINALEHSKSLEWEKLQVEINRSKSSQLAEISAKNEQMLAEIETQRATLLLELKEMRAEKMAELGQIEKRHDQDVHALLEKKKIAEDEIEMLHYEYEKNKAANIIKLEKMREDELKAIESLKKEELAKLDEQLKAELAEIEQKKAIAMRKLNQDKRQREKEIADCELQKATILKEIDATTNQLDIISAEIKTEADKMRCNLLIELEEHKQKKYSELEFIFQQKVQETEETLRKKKDELTLLNNSRQEILNEIIALKTESDRIKNENEAAIKSAMVEQHLACEQMRARKMEEVEAACAARMEQTAEKINLMETSHMEKQAQYRNVLEESTAEITALQEERTTLAREVDALKADVSRIKSNNESLMKNALIERQIELEKYKNDKMEEIENICANRLKLTVEAEQRKSVELEEMENKYAIQKKDLRDSIRDLTRRMENLRIEFDDEKDRTTSEIEKIKREGMDEFTRLKIEKMKEIDAYIDGYREEKMVKLQEELEKQSGKNLRSMEELQKLNNEYEERMMKYNELTAMLEADKRNVYLKEKLFDESQKDFEKIVEDQIDLQKKELQLMTMAKDQQIAFLQEKLQTYANELSEYREDVLADGGKSKKELLADIEFLQSKVNSQQAELQSRPSAAYVISLEEGAKGLEELKRENMKMAIKVAGLEKERHNWQISVFEINRLNEEKIMLEEKLALKGGR